LFVDIPVLLWLRLVLEVCVLLRGCAEVVHSMLIVAISQSLILLLRLVLPQAWGVSWVCWNWWSCNLSVHIPPWASVSLFRVPFLAAWTG